MKVFELSRGYSKKQVDAIRDFNKSAQLYRTQDGKIIFVTHGSKEGIILKKEFGDMVGYDEIFYCYKDGMQRIWTYVFHAKKNGETRHFLFISEQSEVSSLFDQKKVMEICNSLWNEE